MAGFVDPDTVAVPQATSGFVDPDAQSDDGLKPGSLRNIYRGPIGMGENVLQGLTSLSGSIPAGLAGVGTMAGNAMGLTDADPADVVKKVSEKTIYQPQTTAGKQIAEKIQKPGKWLADRADDSGQAAANLSRKVGLPDVMANQVGAGVNTALQAAPALLGDAKLPEAVTKLPKVPDVRFKTRPEAVELEKEGVGPLTPGQRAGGVVKDLEEKAKSIPVLGTGIAQAERRRIEDFNRATVNKALAPIGETLPKDVGAGHEAVAHAQEKISDAYDKLLPKLKGDLNSGAPTGTNLPSVPGQLPPVSFKGEIDNLKSMISQGKMTAANKEELTNFLDNSVLDKFNEHGKIDGFSLKEMEEELRLQQKEWSAAGGGPEKRRMAAAVQETQAALRRMIERENPGYGKELGAINQSYAMLTRVERAAAAPNGGVFGPKGLKTATKVSDDSVRKRASAGGKALLQPWAETGVDVLGNHVPNSGTADRLGLRMMMEKPFTFGGAVAGRALYSDPVLSMVNKLLTTPNKPKAPRVSSPVGISPLVPAGIYSGEAQENDQ